MKAEEKMLAACKLLGRYFYEIYQKTGASNIEYNVQKLTIKQTGEKIGNIKVIWNLEGDE